MAKVTAFSKRTVVHRHLGPKPPRDLKKVGKAFWIASNQAFIFSEIEQKTLLLTCKSLDLISEGQNAIAVEGAVVTSRLGGRAANPWCAIVRDQVLVFMRLCKRLGLDATAPKDLQPAKRGR